MEVKIKINENRSPINDVFRDDYDEDEFKFVMNLFLKEGSQTMSNLYEALDDNDIEKIEFWVHKIAGSAEVVGADNFFPVARSLETSIRETQEVDDDSMSFLKNEFIRIENFVKTL
ncbi:MAG: Hpt domain-containing protein [Flavobacteriales bacterium]|nr:Hpt domain-containing protein [Flavobacteriales bacterium]